jgi:hypothetical protein
VENPGGIPKDAPENRQAEVIIECRNIMRPAPRFGNTLTVELNLTLWAILFAGGSPIIIIKEFAEKVTEVLRLRPPALPPPEPREMG